MGGMSNLRYTLSGGGGAHSKLDGSGGVGYGYTFNFSDRIGIAVGMEIGFYSNDAVCTNISDEYEYGIPGERDHFILSYSMDRYEEVQNVTLMSVPIMLQFKTPIGRTSSHFYFSGGLKFGFPSNIKATVLPGTISASGYYSFEQVEYHTNLPEYGFADKPFDTKVFSFDLEYSTILALETGIRFSLGSNASIYTGAFLDYGLNNMSPMERKPLIEYRTDAPSTFRHSSILNSSMADKVNIFGVGLKVRISFGW
jgi:hypothetical protein